MKWRWADLRVGDRFKLEHPMLPFGTVEVVGIGRSIFEPNRWALDCKYINSNHEVVTVRAADDELVEIVNEGSNA